MVFRKVHSTPWRSYLENLTIDDKFINKFIKFLSIKRYYCKKCWEEKIIRTSYLITFKKYRSSQRRYFIKKLFLRNSQYSLENIYVGFLFHSESCEIFRSTILKNIFEWLLLNMCSWNWEKLKIVAKEFLLFI